MTIVSRIATAIPIGIERVQAEREARAADRDDEQDLLGRVRRRRDGVGGEDRERDRLRDPLVLHLGRGQRPTDEYAFDECHVVGSSEPLSTTGRRQLAIPARRSPIRRCAASASVSDSAPEGDR